jgi:hypothetical protein
MVVFCELALQFINAIRKPMSFLTLYKCEKKHKKILWEFWHGSAPVGGESGTMLCDLQNKSADSLI